MFLISEIVVNRLCEYPLKASAQARAPAGKYTYAAWPGGRQFTGAFSLSKDQDLAINIFKERIGIIRKLPEV